MAVRFTRAVLAQLGSRIDTHGGSTLATQIEKYRHSPGGITHDAREKLRTMWEARGFVICAEAIRLFASQFSRCVAKSRITQQQT